VVAQIDASNQTRGTFLPTTSVTIHLSRPSPSATELIALRKLVAEWKDESLEVLKVRLANRSEWVLDGVPELELENLRKQAHELGVHLVIRPEKISLWRRIIGRRMRLAPNRVRLGPDPV
jgi:hypothetical protein